MTHPVGEPPLEALPPDAPATVEDVRASRRWTWVALAWAVAASAVAVVALIQAGKNNSSDNNPPPTQTTQGVSTQQLEQFQKQTNDRLDAFNKRLADTAKASDVQKLDKRLTTVENDASQAKDAEGKQNDVITQLQSDIKDLQRRVDDLESKQQQNQQNQQQGTTTGP